jgi:hypothetical protein
MLNPESGQLLFSTFLGTDAVEGYGIQRGNGVIAGLQDEAYFFGEVTGGFPATLGTFRTPQSNDSTDPYVVKLRLSFPEERRKTRISSVLDFLTRCRLMCATSTKGEMLSSAQLLD